MFHLPDEMIIVIAEQGYNNRHAAPMERTCKRFHEVIMKKLTRLHFDQTPAKYFAPAKNLVMLGRSCNP